MPMIPMPIGHLYNILFIDDDIIIILLLLVIPAAHTAMHDILTPPLMVTMRMW